MRIHLFCPKSYHELNLLMLWYESNIALKFGNKIRVFLLLDEKTLKFDKRHICLCHKSSLLLICPLRVAFKEMNIGSVDHLFSSFCGVISSEVPVAQVLRTGSM